VSGYLPSGLWRDYRRLITVTLSTEVKAAECANPQDGGRWKPSNDLSTATHSVLEADACRAGGNQSAPPDKVSGSLRALVVEDEPADVELVMRAIRKAGFEATSDVAQTAREFTNLVRKHSYDVILADYKLPNWNGMESVEVSRREGLDIPVILVSGALGELTAVECIKQGAADYVLKDQLARLPDSVRRAMREKRLREKNKQGQEELARSNRDLEQFAYKISKEREWAWPPSSASFRSTVAKFGPKPNWARAQLFISPSELPGEPDSRQRPQWWEETHEQPASRDSARGR
jgi:CheY-like chemotaxis protein